MSLKSDETALSLDSYINELKAKNE